MNPYRYAPDADELENLRDDQIFPNINRKDYPTLYPAGAQISFRIFYALVGDSVTGFKGGSKSVLTVVTRVWIGGRKPLKEVRTLIDVTPVLNFRVQLGVHRVRSLLHGRLLNLALDFFNPGCQTRRLLLGLGAGNPAD